MDVKQYEIDNNSVICRLLPFFLRGRKMISFLTGVTFPLVYIHNQFKDWALEKKIEASITGQIKPLEWYLNHCLNKHLKNKTDWIFFGYYSTYPEIYYHTETIPANYIYNMYRDPSDEGFKPVRDEESGAELADSLYTQYKNEALLQDVILIVYVPEITITKETMRTEITKIIDRYLNHFQEYSIKFTEQ